MPGEKTDWNAPPSPVAPPPPPAPPPGFVDMAKYNALADELREARKRSAIEQQVLLDDISLLRRQCENSRKMLMLFINMTRSLISDKPPLAATEIDDRVAAVFRNTSL